MNGFQNDLHPDLDVLVKFFVLGGVVIGVLFENAWGNFLGHVLCPKVHIIDPSSPCLLHVQ